jgi:uncharacterized protein YuzE
MKITYDKSADAMYLRLSDNDVLISEQNSPGVIIDFDVEGNIVGIEIIEMSKRTDNPEKLIYEVA